MVPVDCTVGKVVPPVFGMLVSVWVDAASVAITMLFMSASVPVEVVAALEEMKADSEVGGK